MSRYIDADAITERINAYLNDVDKAYEMGAEISDDADEYYKALYVAKKFLYAQPTAYVRPSVSGEWVEDELGITVCSNCKNPRRDNRIKHIAFCNSCGADMRGASDD